MGNQTVLTCREILLELMSVLLVINLGFTPEVTKCSSIGRPAQLNWWHSLSYILTQMSCIRLRTYQPIHARTQILCIN